jgi:hypothetical protein
MIEACDKYQMACKADWLNGRASASYFGTSGRLWVRVPCWLIRCPHWGVISKLEVKFLVIPRSFVFVDASEVESNGSVPPSYAPG